MGQTRAVDFSLTLKERQKVQQCRTKLLKALHALDADIEIVQGCQARHRYSAQRYGIEKSERCLEDLEWHLSELRAHRTAAIRIISYCTWTANLVY